MKITPKYIAMVSAATEIQVLRGRYAGPNYEFMKDKYSKT
jgi:hypothetical protein